MLNANNDLNKSKSIAQLDADIDFNKEADFFFGTLATDVEQYYSKKKKKASLLNQYHQAS